MDFTSLHLLGLSGAEIKVYQCVLTRGKSNIGAIHKAVGSERRTIYDAVSKLVKKGLFTSVRENTKILYRCAPLAKLKETLDAQKEELGRIERMLPEMEHAYASSKETASFEVFHGKEGIKTVFEDMLGYKENFFIGGRWYLAKEMPAYWHRYNARRIGAKVKWFNLTLHDAPRMPAEKLMEARTLPREFSGAPSIVFIYGNKVVTVLWGAELLAFSIESNDIAENYKRYHKYLWDHVAK